MAEKKKIVIVGASYRAMHGFLNNIRDSYSNEYDVVGIHDLTIEKVEDLNECFKSNYKAYDDFEKMMEENKPDIAVIANIDCVHIDYLEKIMAAGVTTVVEKPLCIDAEQCKRVRKATELNPSVEAVTAHNLRYHPASLKIKEVLDSGRIGNILSIQFVESLDIDHGTSYFHRWNRAMKNSGGLLIHKSSHHFDLLNWFTGSYADEVFAHGKLLSYGAENCKFKVGEMAETCHECKKTKEECAHRLDLSGPRLEMHKSNLKAGLYTPDLCVYSPEIDIVDHACVGITYKNGVHANYTMCAHSSVESMKIEIEGTVARLEYEIIYSTAPDVKKSDGEVSTHQQHLRVIEFNKPIEEIEIPPVKGSHGGADLLMCKDLFGGEKSDAKATLEDGLQAVLVGIAANESIKTGKAINIAELENA